jgi:cytochrome c biogenesis protein CcmG, thiol:disulfide interchange protein DsbE
VGTRTLIRFAALIAALALATTGCNTGGYPTDINRPAPDFAIHYDGQTVSLKQYRGKIVVLNFWASWCVYCAAEWPSLEQLQSQFPNLVVLAVAFDSDLSDYKQYVVANQLRNMTVILDPDDKSNRAFGTTRPPETYIIDPQGMIRRRFIGAQDWNTPEIQNYIRSLERLVPAKQST